jgi:hypothetical protein
MTDVVQRFKQHLWDTYAIDPQAVVVRLGANWPLPVISL